MRPTVGVVLCAWRGTAHLAEQLDSIGAQTWPVSVTVHDDASGDGTAALARAHPAVERVVEHAGNVGHVGNFERGLADALARGHDHVAFADQDDVWAPDRVERGMERLLAREAELGADRPLLVHSDLRTIDAAGAPLAPSYLARRGYRTDGRRDLARTLGECGVMGNTALANAALGRLALPFAPGVHVHDWWLAALAELFGERLFVDAPLVAYRIHATNASNSTGAGAEHGLRAALGRLPRTLRARDLRLPFLEDGRLGAVRALLEDRSERYPPIDPADRALLERFRRWLELDGPRAALFADALRAGLLRPGLAHRARVGAATLLTRRYDGRRRSA